MSYPPQYLNKRSSPATKKNGTKPPTERLLENQKFKKVSKQGTTFQGLPFVGYVHGPTYLNCKVLPEHMKQAIVDKYDDWYKQYKNKWFGLDRIYGIKNFMLDED